MENDKVKLAQLFEIAKGHGIVHNKGEFASLIGVDNSSLSHALKGDGKIKVENVVTKAEHALMKLGVALDNNAQAEWVSAQNTLPTFCRKRLKMAKF